MSETPKRLAGRLALVTGAFKIDPANAKKLVPDNTVTVIDLKAKPPVSGVLTSAWPRLSKTFRRRTTSSREAVSEPSGSTLAMIWTRS